jgi:hypothetical protein
MAITVPGLKKFALTTHLTFSVGWIGAVCVFVALATVGLRSADAQTVRGVYLVMEHAAWLALLPLAIGTFLTGIIMSVATAWGLFRHYWVVFKLVITVFATIVLLIYMQTFRYMAAVASDPNIDLNAVRNPSPLVHAILALIVLITASVLGIYKPRAVTPYGRRKQLEGRPAA